MPENGSGSLPPARLLEIVSRSVERIVACLGGLSDEDLAWKPDVRDANSLRVLATHTMGNVEEMLLGTLCGQAVDRVRDREFAQPLQSAEAIQARWANLRDRLSSCVGSLPSDALGREYVHPSRGRLLGWEIGFIVATHAAEHMAQAELTRDLLRAARGPSVERR